VQHVRSARKTFHAERIVVYRPASRPPTVAAARLKVMLGDEIPRRMHWPGSSHRGYLPGHQALGGQL
jgi:hypothetical protein